MQRIMQIAVGLVLVAPMAMAEVTPETITYSEYGEVAESLTGVAGNPENGRAVMAARPKGNCIACHAVSAMSDELFHGEIGPSLDGVGDRWTAEQLRGIVANAKNTFPDTVMPAFFKSSGFIRPGDAFTGKAGTEPLPPLLTAQEVEDVVAYLLTIKD